MSDTVTETIQPQEEDKTCPTCGRYDFINRNAMLVHQGRAHKVQRTQAKKNYDKQHSRCGHCGKEVLTKNMRAHERNIHGLYERSKRRPQVRKDDLVTVNDIFDAVIPMLFHGETVPVKTLTAIIKWRRDTEEFLEAIR
jgi:hypothetical protein